MSGAEITIRSIQHYLYCPHRWGLLEIDRAWAENAFVTKANLMHSRVHDPDKQYTSRGKKVFTSVCVYNDREDYNLYGVTDCIETSEAENGIALADSNKKYSLCIVEYKPTMPKAKAFNHDDLMQVFAQKICVDYVFGCDCEAVLYYADVKKRVRLPLKENFSEYDKELKTVLNEMRKNLEQGTIPPIEKGQRCSGCSMKDICMPSSKSAKNLKSLINSISEEQI